MTDRIRIERYLSILKEVEIGNLDENDSVGIICRHTGNVDKANQRSSPRSISSWVKRDAVIGVPSQLPELRSVEAHARRSNVAVGVSHQARLVTIFIAAFRRVLRLRVESVSLSPTDQLLRES